MRYKVQSAEWIASQASRLHHGRVEIRAVRVPGKRGELPVDMVQIRDTVEPDNLFTTTRDLWEAFVRGLMNNEFNLEWKEHK